MKIAELLAHIGFTTDAAPLDEASEKLEGIKRRLEFLAAAEVVRGIYELTERFSGFAEGLNTAAVAAGLSVESLQKLQFAAGQSGVSADEMSQSMALLSRKLYEARSGSAEAAKSFEQVGIDPAQIQSFHSTQEALLAVSNGMSRLTDPVAKQALAMDLFGRSGSRMVAFMSEGGGAISKMGQEAQDMGAVLSGPAVRALQEVEDSLSGFWQIVKTFSATVAAQFAPSIKAFVGDLEAWYKANRALIMVNVRKWIEDLLYAFGFLVGITEVVTQAIMDYAAAHPGLISQIGKLILWLGGLSLGLGALGKLMGYIKSASDVASAGFGGMAEAGKVALKVFTLLRSGLAALLLRLAILTETALPGLSAAFAAMGAALQATPIGWLIAGVAVLVLGVEALYTTFFKKGGNWKDTWIYKIFEKISGAFGWAAKKLGFGDTPDGNSPQSAASDAPPASAAGQVAGALSRTVGMDASQDATTAFSNALGRMQGMSGPAGAMALPGASEASAAMQQITSTINAPITINVPPGTPPQQVADSAKQAVVDHLDKTLREAQRDVRSAQVH
ncbi:MAG: hypothetical protein EOP64_00290 [Sphingomonas sp.]|nr:MAG: hypothetical protein EOP64_00290 [Sphingomonas sp.]